MKAAFQAELAAECLVKTINNALFGEGKIGDDMNFDG
jgi:hypothetical protein